MFIYGGDLRIHNSLLVLLYLWIKGVWIDSHMLLIITVYLVMLNFYWDFALCTYIFIYMYMCVCVCVCVYIYTHIYIHTYVYIYIYKIISVWRAFCMFKKHVFIICPDKVQNTVLWYGKGGFDSHFLPPNSKNRKQEKMKIIHFLLMSAELI